MTTRRQRIKRVLAGGLVVAAAAAGGAGSLGAGSALAAARSGGASGSSGINCHGCGAGKTIRVSLMDVGTTAQMDAWEKYVARQFKRDTGAGVSFTNMQTGTEVLDTIEKGATTGSGPDVLDTDNGYGGDAEAAKIYNPITSADWGLLGGSSQFTPGTQSKKLTGGNTVNWYLHTDLLVYNTKLFKEAGIKSPPKTWAAYLKDASLITKLGNGTYGAPFSAGDAYDPWHEIWMLAQDYGGNFVNKSATEATMTSEPVVKAVEFWFSWYKDGIVDPQSITWTGTQTQGLFDQGKLGMENQTNSGVITDVVGTPAQGDVAFAPMPTVPVGYNAMPPGAPRNGVVGYDFAYTLGVPKWSHEQSLAYRLIRVAVSTPAENLLYRLTASLPTTVASGKTVGTDPLIKPFIQYEGQSTPAPSYAFWGSVENAVAGVAATLARDVQNGSYNLAAVRSALATANAQVQGAISSTSAP